MYTSHIMSEFKHDLASIAVERRATRGSITLAANRVTNSMFERNPETNEITGTLLHGEALLIGINLLSSSRPDLDRIDFADKVIDAYALALATRSLTPSEIQASGLRYATIRRRRTLQIRAELNEALLEFPTGENPELDPIIQGLQARIAPPTPPAGTAPTV